MNFEMSYTVNGHASDIQNNEVKVNELYSIT